METTSLTQTPAIKFVLEPKVVDRSTLNCREIVTEDLKTISLIEQTVFEYPWTQREFEYCLNDKRCKGLLVEDNNNIVGYVFFEIKNTSYQLLSLAVAPNARRRGLGALMLGSLIDSLNDVRKEISCVVRESNLCAQLFLRSMGFRAQWTLRGFYRDSNEDAYKMSFQTEEWAIAAEYIRNKLLTR